jgi:hypothetical protein
VRENRGLYIAAALFIVVAGVYFFADKNAKAPAAAPTPAPSPIVRLAASQVGQVVVHAHGKQVTISREGAGWTYAACAEGQASCPARPADQALSLQLVQSLTELSPSHVIYGAPEGLPAYGVDKPGAGEIDIKGTNGQQVTVLVGGQTPDKASYFVRRQDSQDIDVVAASTIDSEFLGLVDKPPVPQPTPAAGSPAPSPSS